METINRPNLQVRNVNSQIAEFVLPINENATLKESSSKKDGELSDSNCKKYLVMVLLLFKVLFLIRIVVIKIQLKRRLARKRNDA